MKEKDSGIVTATKSPLRKAGDMLLSASTVCWGVCHLLYNFQLMGIEKKDALFFWLVGGVVDLIFVSLYVEGILSAPYYPPAAAAEAEEQQQQQRGSSSRYAYLWGLLQVVVFVVVLFPVLFSLADASSFINRHQLAYIYIAFAYLGSEGINLITSLGLCSYKKSIYGFLQALMGGLICVTYKGFRPTDSFVCKVLIISLCLVILTLCGIYVFLPEETSQPQSSPANTIHDDAQNPV